MLPFLRAKRDFISQVHCAVASACVVFVIQSSLPIISVCPPISVAVLYIAVWRHSTKPRNSGWLPHRVLTLKPLSSCLTLRTEHSLVLPYPLMMSKLTCATMNLNKRGVDKLPHIRDILDELQCNIMSLQEVDVNSFSCSGFVQLGKKLGLSVALGDLSPQTQLARVAIVSNLPFRQIRFSTISQFDRYCAGLVEFRIGESICAICGNAANQTLAKELVHELVNCASQFSCQRVILGDFNLTPMDLHDLDAYGSIRMLDEPFGPPELLPPTGPGHKPRIDFGICGPSLHPTRLKHFQGLGDHLGVSYSFDVDVSLLGFTQPRRAPWKVIDSKLVATEFESLWQEDIFLRTLSTGDTDAACMVPFVICGWTGFVWKLFITYCSSWCCLATKTQSCHTQSFSTCGKFSVAQTSSLIS